MIMMLLGASSEVSRILFDNCEASFGELNPKRLTIKEKEIKFHDHCYKYASMEDISKHVVNYLNSKLKRSDI